MRIIWLTRIIATLVSVSAMGAENLPNIDGLYLCNNDYTFYASIDHFGNDDILSTDLDMVYLPGQVFLNRGRVPFSPTVKYCYVNGRNHCRNGVYRAWTTEDTVNIRYSLEFLNYSMKWVHTYISAFITITVNDEGGVLVRAKWVHEPGEGNPGGEKEVIEGFSVCRSIGPLND